MVTESLLAHVTVRFSSHPENVATESLAYIMGRSTAAKRAFLGFVEHLGPKIPADLVFRPQASGADGSIPDLVGTDMEGREIVIVEAKFWAGLTDNQPVGYIGRLPAGHDAALVVVAPALRLSLLCNELVRRCRDGGVDISGERQPSAEVVVRTIGLQHILAVVSWRALLTRLAHELDAVADLSTISDLGQLQGLCDRMDDDAFLPLRSEELTSSIAARHIQFCRLVDDVANRAVTEKLASVTGVRPSAAAGSYFRPMLLSGFGCYLQVNSQHWSRRRSTPIWLSVKDSQWKLTQVVKDALAPLEIEDPPRVIHAETELLVPLRLPLGVERSVVLDAVFAQVSEVADLLARRAATGPA